jgi:hypothetical protein
MYELQWDRLDPSARLEDRETLRASVWAVSISCATTKGEVMDVRPLSDSRLNGQKNRIVTQYGKNLVEDKREAFGTVHQSIDAIRAYVQAECRGPLEGLVREGVCAQQRRRRERLLRGLDDVG